MRFQKAKERSLGGKNLENNEEIEVKWIDGAVTQHAVVVELDGCKIMIQHHGHKIKVNLEGLKARRC